MLFTRTLRRKLMFGVGLVLVMLLILSVSGIVGLSSYRNVIHKFDDQINRAPQHAELIQAIASLVAPFPIAGDDREAPRTQRELQRDFRRRFESVDKALHEYRRRVEDLPPATEAVSQKPLTEAILNDIEWRRRELERLARDWQSHRPLSSRSDNDEGEPDPWLAELHDRRFLHDLSDLMVWHIAGMLEAARNMPDPVDGLQQNLNHARNVYRSSLVAVWVASSVVLVLFLGLLRYGYIWIFHPIRQLHQGALRVAHGDFDYRVKLKSRDEMAELADAFNQMTARFQEIAAHLDAQVQERSRQLVRSERLASVGFLAAGVAHEINNPLSAIAMAAESLESRVAAVLERLEPQEASVVRQYLQMIQSESFRCKQITERLLDFSRAREAVREPTDLTNLIAEVVAMVQCLGKYREKTIAFTRTAACFAEVSGSEIKQVVLNLIANGLDAVDRGGGVEIELIEQTDHVRIEFRDDGCGMTGDVMENMFEPFFTKKPVGQGTGLGLSISHRIVSQHGGTIWATSPGPGQGSTFVIRLPRRAPQANAA